MNRLFLITAILGTLSVMVVSHLKVSNQMGSNKHSIIPSVEIDEKKTKLVNNDGTLSVDGVPFSGYLVLKDEMGRVQSKRGCLKGKLEGEWTTYYANGKIKSRRPYHIGLKQGNHMGYYPDGQVKFCYYFEKGLAEGTHRTWYRDGSLATELNYANGHELGSQKVWRSDGKLKSNYVVKENGRQYGMLGLKRCAKIDSETGYIQPYNGTLK